MNGTNTTALLTAAAIVITLASGGCSSAPSGPAEHAYVGIDTSRSWEPYLAASAQGAAHVAAILNPDRDKLSVYRVDAECEEFYDASVPDSADAFQDRLIGDLQALPIHSRTYPARFWFAVAAAAQSDPGRVTVIFFTDGDNDDQNAASKAQIEAAASSLAHNSHVEAVAIFGASPSNWAELQTEFRPLGPRLHLCSARDLSNDSVDAAFRGNAPLHQQGL